jgi:ABC-type transport system involved in cytochrome bd biosynthesis fused ATPase/permease subunit
VIVSTASFEATATLPAAALNFNASFEAAGRLFSFGNPKVPEQKNSNTSHKPAKHLAVEHLNFSYDETDYPTLQDINFELHQGEKKAIVGISGAGKTSLLDLFLRFQDPSSGKVLVDQIDLREIDPANLPRIFGMIPQNPYVFTTSLRENLKLAKPEASDSALKHALVQAELWDWVDRLPDGLDTWVEEHGIRMSAGERQRLAIARVLLQDTPFILLDEPTANLDPVNETRVLQNLFRLSQNKGILLVTHRLRLLEQMDEILVLDGSTIAERGDYGELIQKGQIFTRLVELDQDSLAENKFLKND